MRERIEKYKDFLAYIFFGVCTTVVNIAAYGVCTRCGWTTGKANIAAWVLAVLFAYLTNRQWVFHSENHTAVLIFKEFLTFLACRIGTGVVDQVIMLVGVDHIGPKYIPSEFLFFWGMAVKTGSNVLVILLNYIFSKLLIFTKKGKEAE